MTSKYGYKLTTVACFLGIFVEAVVINITAVLFVPLMNLYGFSYGQLGLLVTINFTAQVAADVIFSGAIDRIGYRKLALPATLIAFAGYLLFAAAPVIFERDMIYTGLVIATIVFSFSCGLLEVLLSPMIAAIPGDKTRTMSLLHSFYAWGQAAAIIVTTLLIYILGQRNWQIIILIWSVLPLVNFFMFLRSPFPDVIPEEHRTNFFKVLLNPFFIVALLAILFGAGAEVVMNQWASAYMEKGLGFPKVTGDLLGMTGFALMLGLARMLYGKYSSKIDLHKVLVASSFAAAVCYAVVAFSPFKALSVAACILCGLTVSMLWPGTLVVSHGRFPMAGAWLFAYLAIAGDLGASIGPWLTGNLIDKLSQSPAAARIADAFGVTQAQGAMRLGILAAVVFPLLTMATHYVLLKLDRKSPVTGDHGQ